MFCSSLYEFSFNVFACTFFHTFRQMLKSRNSKENHMICCQLKSSLSSIRQGILNAFRFRPIRINKTTIFWKRIIKKKHEANERKTKIETNKKKRNHRRFAIIHVFILISSNKKGNKTTRLFICYESANCSICLASRIDEWSLWHKFLKPSNNIPTLL